MAAPRTISSPTSRFYLAHKSPYFGGWCVKVQGHFCQERDGCQNCEIAKKGEGECLITK